MAGDLEIISTADGTRQRSVLRPAAGREARPLLVVMHTWQGSVDQKQEAFVAEAQRRGWHLLAPDFRGPNDRPESCGSDLAVQDVVDAVAEARSRCRVDGERVYIAGGSGGGHMTLLMAGRHGGLFAAASAWCGITDLAAWHRQTAGSSAYAKYARSIERVVGGKPGDSRAIDADLAKRSPVTYLDQAGSLPIQFAAGVHDGVEGSVPFSHTVEAFNRVAEACGQPGVSRGEVDELAGLAARVRAARGASATSPAVPDPRRVYLRRAAGRSELVIFDGGHECLAAEACGWLARFRRQDGGCVEYLQADPPADGLARADGSAGSALAH